MLSMQVTLVSISCLTETDYHAVFDGSICQIFDVKCSLVGQVEVANSLYEAKTAYLATTGAVREDRQLTMEDLHAHLSYIRVGTICEMLTKGIITDIMLDPNHSTMDQCTSCKYGKATQKPIGKVHEPSYLGKVSDEIHTDIWGPSPVQTPRKCSYYSSFTNDHTHYTHVSLMAVKSNMFQAY